MKHRRLAVLLLIAVAGYLPASNPAYNNEDKVSTQIESAPGLTSASFNTPHGKLTVNLPDDMALGDTISGTVIAEPAGNTEGETRRNADVLSGYVVEAANNRAPVRDKVLKWIIPTAGAGRALDLVLKDAAGTEVARQTVPLQPQPAAPAGQPPASPGDFYLPPIWQTGKPVEILGRFGGDFANTRLRLNATDVNKLAESPRKLTVESPRNIAGPASAELREGPVTATGECRNVKLSLSAPRTTLRRGETTPVTIRIEGLQDLRDVVQIQLANRSPQVVRMERGNNQTTFIHPQDVQPGGVAVLTRTLTGAGPGRFDIAAIVYPQPLNLNQWAAEKGLADNAEQFGEFVESVKKDLDAYAAKGGMTKAGAEDIKGRLDACKELARTDLEAAKRCADLVLRGVAVVQVAAKLWLSGFELYKTAITLIVGSLGKEELEIPWELINETLKSLIEGAEAAGDKKGAELLREAKNLKEAAEKGGKVTDKLKEAIKKLQDYKPAPK